MRFKGLIEKVCKKDDYLWFLSRSWYWKKSRAVANPLPLQSVVFLVITRETTVTLKRAFMEGKLAVELEIGRRPLVELALHLPCQSAGLHPTSSRQGHCVKGRKWLCGAFHSDVASIEKNANWRFIPVAITALKKKQQLVWYCRPALCQCKFRWSYHLSTLTYCQDYFPHPARYQPGRCVWVLPACMYLFFLFCYLKNNDLERVTYFHLPCTTEEASLYQMAATVGQQADSNW